MSSKGRVMNFSPGPGAFPEEVLYKARDEMLNYNGLGMSIMELSHRTKEFDALYDQIEADLRSLMNIPNNYKVLFMQGGCTGMYAAVPLNLLTKTGKADYIVTGYWSDKAVKEARKYGEVHLVVPEIDEHLRIPPREQWKFSEDSDYVFYCDNETIGGVEFNYVPETNGRPLVVDMSSNILTRRIDVSKFGCIMAGSHKNLGPAGVTLVIVREDLLGRERPECPSVWNFKNQAEAKSLVNTPPCYTIYVNGLMFKHLLKQGGIKIYEERNTRKAKLFYDTLEQSKGFYTPFVSDKDSQSRVNIPFHIGGKNGNEELENKFVEQAKLKGLVGLAGHSLVGACRASIYNAVTMENVECLCNFMKQFQLENQN